MILDAKFTESNHELPCGASVGVFVNGGEPYVLPIATYDTLGGVKASAPNTNDMTQPVGVDKEGKLWTYPCAVNPMPKTDDMTQAVGVDVYGSLWTTPSEGGGGEPYVLPVATSSILGGVKAATWTEDMTQAIGVDENGGLWTYPCEGGGSVTLDTTLTQEGMAADAKAVGDKIGDIETALDGIIAIQNELIGGVANE